MNEYILFETTRRIWLYVDHRSLVQFTPSKDDATPFSKPFDAVIRYHKLEKLRATLEMHDPEWVLFNGDRSLGQNQYASRYIGGRHGYPDLGEGLRFKGSPFDYHDIRIHRDDYDTFHERVRKHMAQNDWKSA